MRVKIVLDQNDLFGVREVDVRYVFENMGIINGSAMIRDFYMSPALQRGEQHKEVRSAVALIFAIDTLRAPLFHQNWRARLGHKLFGGLVQTDERLLGIVRLRINIQLEKVQEQLDLYAPQSERTLKAVV